MSSSIHVRPATPDDAAGIVAVLTPIIESRRFTVFDTPFTVEQEREFIARFPERGIFNVAVDETTGTIVGLQNLEPVAPYTGAMDHVASCGTYVDLTRRRQGIAARLFAASIAAASVKGYEKIFTLVRADNPAALQTYLRHGFVIIGTARRHVRIDGEYIDEILIERVL